MVAAGEKNDRFIRDFIPKVSRTFALTIKFLPRGLRDTVYASYLLCRVADTLEDSPHLEPAEKYSRLLHLKDLLNTGASGRPLSNKAVTSLYRSVNPDLGDDHRLLSESTQLFEILDALPTAHKAIIYRWTAEMAGGMADYSRLRQNENSPIAVLRDIDDWDRYCYYVAGTVGNMLTELFVLHYDIESDKANKMTRLGESFALGLQKVNVLKDVPVDRERGICYLPLDVIEKYGLTPESLATCENKKAIAEFITELVRLTIIHLDDAIKYTLLISRNLKGVRMFLAVPIFLAIETLSLIGSHPLRTISVRPVKLTRRDVIRLVNAAAVRIRSNNELQEYYKKLRKKAGQ